MRYVALGAIAAGVAAAAVMLDTERWSSAWSAFVSLVLIVLSAVLMSAVLFR